jgi:hypothetical protein
LTLRVIYTAVTVWAVILLVTGQKLSSDLLRPLSILIDAPEYISFHL